MQDVANVSQGIVTEESNDQHKKEVEALAKMYRPSTVTEQAETHYFPKDLVRAVIKAYGKQKF